MSLKTVRRILWVFTGIAAFVVAWLMVGADKRGDLAGIESDPPFSAEFELIDHQGMLRTQDDFAGQWMLVFFGFTNCPDVCPTTLSEVAAVMDGLGDEAAKVQPIFITIDPERDTPMTLSQFVPLFNSNIIGLTGTPRQIAKTSETFPIFYERIEEAAAPGGYTMGHTSHLFFFDPEAGFAESWPYGTRAEEILADLRERI